MNWLIIHNDNLPFDIMDSLKNDVQTVFKLDISPANQSSPSYVFDGELHSLLTDCFHDEHKYNVIFIPYNLSKENYLEFTGIRTALHIRLTKDWNNTTTPIVFYGCDHLEQVAKITKYPKILFSKSSYHVFEENIDKFYNIALKVERLNNASWIDLVLNLDLTPPTKYITHHDIANEYALFKWSKDIGCLDSIPSLKYQFGTRPYFKLLDIKSEIEYQDKKGILSELKCETETNILLIDDQANEGWALFYTALFRSQSKIDFTVFDILDAEGEIKKIRQESQDSIINKVLGYISKLPEDKLPDVILLDLRLCSIDFNLDSKPRDLTGIKLVEKIREHFNKGIQIVITSASDKIWNYIELSEKGINGYIIKSATKQFENHPVTSIILLINKLIPRATYLKSIFKLYDFVKSNYKNLIRENTETYEANLDVAFEYTLGSFDKQKHLNFAYLIVYQLFEIFLKSDAILKEDSGKFIIYNGETGIVFRKLIKDKSEFNEKFFVQIIDNLNLLHENSEGEDKEKIKKQIDFYFDWRNVQDDKFWWNNPIKIELKDEKVTLSPDKNRIEKENPNFSLSKDVTRKAAYVLAYRYGYDKVKMEEFNKIRIIRHTKTAHGDNQELVTHDEMKKLWEFFSFLFNPDSLKRNYQDYEIESFSILKKGPQVKVVGKIDLAALQKKFNSRNR